MVENLLDVLPFILFITVWWIGSQISRTISHRREMARRQFELAHPQPVCGCGHHFSFHDEKGCHAERETPVRWSREPGEFDKLRKTEVEWELRECGCVNYTGPQPLTTLYTDDLSNVATRRQITEAGSGQ